MTLMKDGQVFHSYGRELHFTEHWNSQCNQCSNQAGIKVWFNQQNCLTLQTHPNHADSALTGESRVQWNSGSKVSRRQVEPRKFDGIREKISTSKTGLGSFVFDLGTCKLLSSYLSPTGVDRNIVWDILKKSPMDPQPILCQVDQQI